MPRRPTLRFEPLEDRTAPAVTLVSAPLPGGPYTANGSSVVAGRSAISADGQRVVYTSLASDITAAPQAGGGGYNAYLWDRAAGANQLVTVDATGTSGTGLTGLPQISPNGRFVAFTSNAANVTAGFVDGNGSDAPDVFARDTLTGTTELISVNRPGTAGANGTTYLHGISDDGRYVYFRSAATDLTADPIAANPFNLFARDRQTGTTKLVNVTAAGTGATDVVYYHQNGTAGRYVVFSTTTPGVVPSRTSQLFIRDLQNDVTYGIAPDSMAADRAAVASPDGRFWLYRATWGASRLLDTATNVTRNLTGDARDPLFSADGRYVVYAADGAVWRCETATGAVQQVASGVAFNAGLYPKFGVSASGSRVAFLSTSRLAPEDTNTFEDVYVRDLNTGTTTLLSRGLDGTAAGAGELSLSASGEFVAFNGGQGVVPNDPVRGGSQDGDVFLAATAGGAVEPVSRRSPLATTANAASRVVGATPDGRYVVFASIASDLVTGTPTRNDRLFRYDRQTGTTELVTRNADGTVPDRGALLLPTSPDRNPVITPDGRYIVFTAADGDLVPGDVNGQQDVFVRDMVTGTTRLVSRNRLGTGGGDGWSVWPSISADGRYVLFASRATNLTDTPALPSSYALYRHDLLTGVTAPLLTDPDGRAAGIEVGSSGDTYYRVTPTGDTVLANFGAALLPTDDNARADLYLVGAATRAVTLASAAADGRAVGSGYTFELSSDGRVVLFSSVGPNIAPGTFDPGVTQVFVRDAEAGTTEWVAPANGGATLSPDGRRVAFFSTTAATGVPVSGRGDVYVRDRTTGETTLASVNAAGTAGGNAQSLHATPLGFSDDGRFLAFISGASDLTPDDANGRHDLFVRDLDAERTVNLTGGGIGNGVFAGVSHVVIPRESGAVILGTSGQLGDGDLNRAGDVFVLDFTPVGVVRGVVYVDAERDGVRGPADPGRPGRTVVVDANGNGSADPGEPTAVTDAAGRYQFFGLPVGTHSLVVVPGSGEAVVAPAGGSATVNVADPTAVVAGPDFGLGAALPDLTVTAATAPAAALAGHTIQVTWEVTNAGLAATDGPWQDALFLSADDVLDASDRLLRVEPHAGTLAPAGRYTATARVALDGPFEGAFHLFVVTDRRNQVGEGGPWEGNNRAAAPVAVTVPLLAPGATLAAAFDDAAATHYFRLDVPADESFAVRFEAAAADGANRVVADPLPERATPPAAAFRTPGDAADAALRLPRGPGGRLTVAVEHRGGVTHPYPYTITASPLALTLDAASPAAGAGRFTVRLDGADFTPATTAELARPGAPARAAAAVRFTDSTRLDATFDAAGFPPGSYSLVVRDGSRAAEIPFTVAGTPAPGRVEVRLVAPGQTRAGRDGELVLEYANTGGQDVPAPVFLVSAEGGTVRYPVADSGARDRLYVLGVNPNGPAGVLPAGAVGRVSLLFRNLQTGLNGRYTVGVIDPAAAFDWGTFAGNVGGAAIAPADLTALAARARDRFGTTWGEVVGTLTGESVNLPGGAPTSTDFSRLVAAGVFAAEITRTPPLPPRPANPPGVLHGLVFLDRNENQVFDPQKSDGNNDWGLQGWVVYVDLDRNGVYDEGIDPKTTTDDVGYYTFHLDPGVYQVRVLDQLAYRPTSPTTAVVSGATPSPLTDIPVRFDVIDSRPAYNPSEHVGAFTVDLIRVGPTTPGARTFVLAHGWNGIDGNNRIIPLAQLIRTRYGLSGAVNVYVVDWSGGAITNGGGALGVNPFGAADGIDPAADQLAAMLLALRINPETITGIGESFGTYVMNRAAGRMFAATGRKTARLVAFNPAEQTASVPYDIYRLRGFDPADISFSYAFHAEDTALQGLNLPLPGLNLGDIDRRVADIDLKLQVDPHVLPPNEWWYWGHVFGFYWMIAALEADTAGAGYGWLDKTLEDFRRCPDSQYDGTATLDWRYVPGCEDPEPDKNLLPATQPGMFRVYVVHTVGSFDPNEKVGPAGVGADGFLPAGGIVPYTIRFENEAARATAPAQEVFVTDRLDPDLDWGAVELGAFGFAGRAFDLPAGLRAYRGRVDAENADGSPLLVDVEIALDPVTGVLAWAFRSVDPATGTLPADPLAGFLPVNDGSGRGEGFVRFTTRPRADLPTGTRIENAAEIVFDLNAPIATNTTLNTLDAAPPASAVEPLAAAASGPTFPVRWAGDDPGGSGVATYTVYVSDDGGPFVPFVTGTTATAATFAGLPGHTYRFFSVAVDAVGNVEPPPTGGDAATTVPPTPPPVAPGVPTPGRPVSVGGAADGSVRLFTRAGDIGGVSPFGNTGTGTRAASADVDGDGVADVVAVTGPGTPLRVAVLSGADGSALAAPFDPFGGDFTGGGFVSAGDLDGDGRAEFVVTPDQGGGPRVTVYSLDPDGTLAVRLNFFGIDDPTFRGGARAAVGDVNGDGPPDLVVAAGFGGGPRVAIFDGRSVLAGNPTRLVGDFFAFPGADAESLRNGAYVAAGDVTGDGKAELVFGGGPGGAPRVFVLDGARIAAGDFAGAYANPVANFFVAGNETDRGGARVGVTDSDGDELGDVVVGSGAGRPAKVRLYLGKDFAGGEPPATEFDPFGGAVLADGLYVG